MLSRDALNSALPLTDILDSRSLRLVAIPGTPLDELVKATRSDANFNIMVGGEYQPDLDSIEYIANAKDPILGGSPHDVTSDHIVQVASTAVREHMVFAKNVVAPAVQQLVENTAATLSEMTPSSLLGMEVIVWEAPKPLTNSSLVSAVRKFETVPYDTPRLGMKLPSITFSEMMEIMGSGSGSLDKDIAFWAAAKGESYFIKLWETVFQQKQVGLGDTQVVTFRDIMEDRIDGWDNALAVFLISRKLYDNPLPETTMNVVAHNALMVEFRNQSAARIARALTDMEKVVKNKILIRSFDHRTTVVNSEVYRAWIEAGGDNEVLFGNLLELPTVVTVDQINAKAAGLKLAWQRHAALTATIESNKRFARTKEILTRHFAAQLAAITDDSEGTLGNRMAVQKLFDGELRMVSAVEIDDLWALCLKLVCRSRFYRTEAERILGGIERIKKMHPEIDVREAAAASVIEYVAYWVGTQFKVVPI